MRTKWQQWLLLAIVTGLWSMSSSYASASTQPEQLHWSERSIHKWSNGAKVQSNVDRNGSLQISTSTQGLNKGFYSAYLYELQNRDWSGSGELRFSVRNDSDQALPLNVVITRADRAALTVSNERQVILIPKATKQPGLVQPVNGLIELAPGFEGEVRVPFSSLMIRNKPATAGHVTPGNILSWGITMTTSENAQLSYRIGNVKLVSAQEAFMENSLSAVHIHGDERVVIPVAGQSVAQYTVIGSPESSDVQFQLAHPVQGVSITSDGLLTLETEADGAKSVVIQAVIDEKWRSSLSIALDPSTAMKVKEADGTPRFIPAPDQVSKVLEPSAIWLKPWMEWMIRISLLLIGLLVVIPYWLWRREQRAFQSGKAHSMNHRRSKRLFRM
ncbi:hypothetical protein HNR77_005500 [Paenibacillus sp. JGP012]|uniref:hypothetical protein n=1 Tax=Paenibacillus sp. JGP012 TaxID=2735914 RepID=UPI00161D7F31|nr:hypothetical protein [Paenibacillus sp. JGP012]MBB6024390.1 hypothetical protein [Paenibacillus sp. JGP012]